MATFGDEDVLAWKELTRQSKPSVRRDQNLPVELPVELPEQVARTSELSKAGQPPCLRGGWVAAELGVHLVF